MTLLADIRRKFLGPLAALTSEPEPWLDMIRPANDSKFGDYQVNCAMQLQKQLGMPSRDIAQKLLDAAELDRLVAKAEVAGAGFINLTIADSELQSKLSQAYLDERLGVAKVSSPLTVVIDYSSPNVAKPMHVGHIRSTVIGDALKKILRFAGHRVIADNHLGDWGTQFGMIIYGYKNFLDESAYQRDPIQELGRLYRLVRKLMDYHAAHAELPTMEGALENAKASLARLEQLPSPADKDERKQLQKQISAAKLKLEQLQEDRDDLARKINAVHQDVQLLPHAAAHAKIGARVLEETARLHQGDKANRQLWHQVLPHCLRDIARIYARLGIQFDYELGESFYHDRLADVITSLEEKGLITASEGAKCIFDPQFEAPMIVQKKDGAFLYATTDLATIQYRVDTWNPALVLYVVDHRQADHFKKLFAATRRWGYEQIKLVHVEFGTVLGDDKKPMKTRDGDTVGLEGLLDEAVNRAYKIVCDSDNAKPTGPELSEDRRREIANVVGLGALKYADLSQNRTSDYVFNYDKMLAMKGNTATYLQYSYARVQGIFRKGDYKLERLRSNPVPFLFDVPIARRLGLALLRFGEAIDEVQVDFRPNLMANYLYDLTETFFKFYDECSVKDAPSEQLRLSRLQFCDLTARVIEQGLSCLGISVVEQM
ncbi:MAG TPA: arginine--tRNA ligase [Pirellulaceae bacterium]|nr:arginine--tRNA ligase [Pirellulaceae bacterium]HMO92349.1 arginine--tRNA ligase [Pirellulaceae bacterium]HMP69273.1 arginine--tRNA ligase [Pirellulaceae bacterium]